MDDIFECSLWNNGKSGWGISVGRPNARRFFSQSHPEITVQFEGQDLTIALDRGKGSNTFWGKCPEFRHPAIKQWVQRNGVTKANKGLFKFEMRIIKRHKCFQLGSMQNGFKT